MKILIKVILLAGLILWTIDYGLSTASAEIPHLINYQGKLADSEGKPITATKSITFRIYDVSSGGTPLWEEIQSVTIDKGIFNVLLGSTTNLNLPFDKPYFLAIKVETDAEMTPRQRITSAGYAFRAQDANSAQNADTVNGIQASTTPEPNKLLALNSEGKFPSSALKVYDSGWFAIAKNSVYTLNHNLGTQKLLIQLYYAVDPNGTNMTKFQIEMGSENLSGAAVTNITSNQLTISVYPSSVYDGPKVDGSSAARDYRHSGYAKVIAIALE